MQNEKKKRLGALDIFIIFAVLSCIIGVGIRYFTTKNTSISNTAQLEDYILTFEIYNIRDSSAQNYLEKGTNFYLQSNNERIGTLREGVTVREAERYEEMPDGRVVKISNNGTGDLYRVDVEGSFDCKGILNENGSFLLNGNHYIGINKEISIYSKYVTFTVKITGIAKS